MSELKNNIKIILVLICLAGLISCKDNSKSDLVNRLERIFYAEDFTEIPDRTYNVVDFGGSGDGKYLNTTAIQEAIDEAHKSGGGRVVFPPGTYLTGAVFVKSNVELHIGEDVVIKAIQDDSQYPERKTRIAGIEMEWPSALINIYQQKNVRITGKGTIDGNGKYWWDKFWGDPKYSGGMWQDYKERNVRWAIDYDCKRVRPVVVYESKNVLLESFTVERAGFWTISLTYSDRVHVNGLVIRNNIGGFGPSSDGVNTDSSTDVLVENCDIDCNDDNLCIKSGKDADGLRVNRPAKNIVYRNCITRSGHGLITLGSETSGGMENIEVYGLQAIGTNIGIRFKSAKVRGGEMKNIWFHDIAMRDVDHPFHFELNWYPEYSYPKIPKEIPEDEIPDRWRVITAPVTPPELGIPEFHDIKISQVNVENAKYAFYANAYEEKPMRNLTWENINIEAQKSGSIRHARDWKMTNVLMEVKDDGAIEKLNCEGVELPKVVSPNKIDAEKPTLSGLDEQLYKMRENGLGMAVFPVGAKSALSQGDTTLYSDTIQVHVLRKAQATLKFYEPLGDGFYYAPVEISVKDNGNIVEVLGQKMHQYAFVLDISEKPENMANSLQWSYDDKTKRMTVFKKGKQFQLDLRSYQ